MAMLYFYILNNPLCSSTAASEEEVGIYSRLEGCLCVVVYVRLPTCCKSKELLQFSNVSSIGFTLLDNIRRERNRAAWRRLERIEYNVVGMYLDVSIVLLTSSAGTNIGFLVQ